MSISDPRQPHRGGSSGPAPFGAVLRELRSRAGLSQNALARRAEVDPAYINRLEKPPRAPAGRAAGPPRRPVVLRLAEATELGPIEADRLLAAAGHCPEAIARLGGWDPTLATVAELLAGPDGPAARRAIVRLAATFDTARAATEPDGVSPTTGRMGYGAPPHAPAAGPPTPGTGCCPVGRSEGWCRHG